MNTTPPRPGTGSVKSAETGLIDSRDPRDRFTLQAERDFRASIRPVYRTNVAKARVEHVGSCLLLRIDGGPIIVTAAHVLDDLNETSLCIVGRPGSSPVPIFGGVVMLSRKAQGDRHSDHFDFAFWKPPAAAVTALGSVEFLDSSRISSNDAPTFGRLYTAIGYPHSRNKKKANHTTKQISTRISMYTGSVEAMPEVAAKLKVSGREHLFLRFEERSFTSESELVNTFGPRGLSGGALLDLGDFTSPESYARDPRRSAQLSGMVIEYYSEHRALVAVKIDFVVSSVRRALARETGGGAG